VKVRSVSFFPNLSLSLSFLELHCWFFQSKPSSPRTTSSFLPPPGPPILGIAPHQLSFFLFLSPPAPRCFDDFSSTPFATRCTGFCAIIRLFYAGIFRFLFGVVPPCITTRSISLLNFLSRFVLSVLSRSSPCACVQAFSLFYSPSGCQNYCPFRLESSSPQSQIFVGFSDLCGV